MQPGVEEFDFGLGDVDLPVGLGDHSLGGNALLLLVGLGLELVVLLDAVEEAGPGGGHLDVLDSDMDALGDDPLPHLLVDDHSDGAGVDVEDAAGPAVVVFVGHALVDGAVDDDVHDVPDLVGGQGFGDVDGSVLFESLSELVPGSPLVPVSYTHLTLPTILLV